MRELYIYYRVADAHAASARAAVDAMQTRLKQAHPHLLVRLMRRAETADGLQTWMETYATVASGAAGADGIDAALQAAINDASLDLQPWLASPRHTEIFEVFNPCVS